MGLGRWKRFNRCRCRWKRFTRCRWKRINRCRWREEGSIEVDAEVFDGPFVETDAGEAAVVSGDGEVDKHVLRCGKLLNLIPRSATRLWRLLMELLTLDRSFIMF